MENKNNMLKDLAREIGIQQKRYVHFYDDTGRNIKAYYGTVRPEYHISDEKEKGFNHTHAENLVVKKLEFGSVADVLRKGKE